MFTIDLDKYRIIDLSYEVIPGQEEDILGYRPFITEKWGYLSDGSYTEYVVKTHSHVGTHVEGALHFFGKGKSITQMPLTAFMGRAILLSVRLEEPNLEITTDYLEDISRDLVRMGDIVICRNDGNYPGDDPEKFPHLTPQAADWFTNHKVKMIGLHRINLGKTISTSREFEGKVMANGVTFVEFLENVDQLEKREFFFMALPFKVKEFGSSWTRAIAIEEI